MPGMALARRWFYERSWCCTVAVLDELQVLAVVLLALDLGR